MAYTQEQVDRAVNPSRVSVYLPSPHNQVLTLADTWYPLTAAITDGNAIDFTLRGSPDYDILYSGESGEFSMVGNADLELDGAGAEVEFGLFVNGVEEAKFTSTTDFPASLELKSFGSNGFFNLTTNDEIDIRAKCTVAGHTLTIANMKVSLRYIGVSV